VVYFVPGDKRTKTIPPPKRLALSQRLWVDAGAAPPEAGLSGRFDQNAPPVDLKGKSHSRAFSSRNQNLKFRYGTKKFFETVSAFAAVKVRSLS
jgi:hypothetical protein